MDSLHRKSKTAHWCCFKCLLILEVSFLWKKILKVNPLSRVRVQRFQTSYHPLWHPLSGCMKKKNEILTGKYSLER